MRYPRRFPSLSVSSHSWSVECCSHGEFVVARDLTERDDLTETESSISHTGSAYSDTLQDLQTYEADLQEGGLLSDHRGASSVSPPAPPLTTLRSSPAPPLGLPPPPTALREKDEHRRTASTARSPLRTAEYRLREQPATSRLWESALVGQDFRLPVSSRGDARPEAAF